MRAESGVHRRNAWETDSKSVARKGVGVQVPPGAPSKIKHLMIYVGRGGDRRLATIRQPSGEQMGVRCPRSFFGCSAPSESAMSFASTFGACPQWPGGHMLSSCYRHAASATSRPRHSGPMPRRMLNAPMRRTLSASSPPGEASPGRGRTDGVQCYRHLPLPLSSHWREDAGSAGITRHRKDHADYRK